MTAIALPQTATQSRDGRAAPRWAVVTAHLTALITLPSALWRLPLAFGASNGMLDQGQAVQVGPYEAIYIVALSIVTEGLALLTLGLVRPWGERVPDWFPLIGGRRIPPMAVIVPAALGAALLAGIWAFAFRNGLDGLEFTGDGWKALILACYLPLLGWAPLLAATTYAYYQRRCRD